MNASPDRRNLVIGVGNPDRGDDAAGLLVARHVKQARPAGVSVFEESGDGAAMMELWKGAGTVIVIDAAHSPAEPGKIFRFDAGAAPIPTESFCHSTHALGLAAGIELSRVLNQLPGRLIVYGIAGANFALGTNPSVPVEAAAREVAERIFEELREG